MDVINAICTRLSVRKYTPEPVEDAQILDVIEAARLAPSGNNAQPWRYIAVVSDEVKTKLREREIIRDKWVYDAPVILVCCTDPSAYTKRDEEWDDPNDIRAIRDLSLATSQLVLRATELGLGMCYCGWIKKEEIKEVLDLPDQYIVPYVLAIGHPAEAPAPRARKTIEEIFSIV